MKRLHASLVLLPALAGCTRDPNGRQSFGATQPPAIADLAVAGAVNVTRAAGNHVGAAVAMDPANTDRVFVLSPAPGGGMFAAFSTDRGQTWLSSRGPQDTNPTDFLIANGGDGLPAGCCDVTVSWDALGNLFAGYVAGGKLAIAVSTDGGATFAAVTTLGASIARPTIAAGPGSGGSAGSLWVTYAVTSGTKSVVAHGAKVSGPGVSGVAAFTAPVVLGTGDRDFGDLAVGPSGQVAVAFQTPTTNQGPSTLIVRTDPDGFGSAAFGAAVTITSTNVGGQDAIPPQPDRRIDAGVGLAYDRSSGPRRGRLYAVYTDETVAESDDTDIFLRFSTNNGATWSSAVRVNEETTNSQFLPRIAVSASTGDVGLSWYDARNDDGNTMADGRGNPGDTDGLVNSNAELYLAVSGNGGTSFVGNVAVSERASAQAGANGSVPDLDHGDYTGLAFASGVLQAVWADNSNSTEDNPDGTLGKFDLYTARVSVILNEPPVAMCKSVSTPVGAGCKAPVTPAQVDDGSHDPEQLGVTLSLTPAGPFNVGNTNVTLTATDPRGDSATCTAVVSVTDTVPPVLTAPSAVTITSCSNANIGQATATDICTVTITNNKPSKFPLGVTVVTWTARDTAGNTVTATQQVTAVLGDDKSCCPSGTNIILGTSVSNTITGTSGKDCILGLGGDDIIDGRDGDDFISGGAGRDNIFGGNGNDRIYGGADDDTINAAPGTNILDGGNGNDTCFVGATDTAISCNP